MGIGLLLVYASASVVRSEAISSMSVTELGMVMEVRPLQSRNAQSPMLVCKDNVLAVHKQ